MVLPHLDNEYPEIQKPSRNGDHDDFIVTYLKTRFARLRNLTQPRKAMERAKKDFEAQRERERALEREELSPR